MTSRLTTALAVAAAVVTAASPLAAQGGYFSSDNLGYLGAVTCYSTLADAIGQTGATCGSATVQRDLSLYFVDGNPGFATPPLEAIFVTNNYAGAGDAVNPNATNVGFVQMYDADGGSVQSMTTEWDPSLTVFHLAASGGGSCVTATQDCVLWTGGSQAKVGSFVSWNIDAYFAGFTQATYDASTGVYASQSDPTTVTGTLSGIFADATTGQYYAFNATLNSDSWAVANGYGTTTVAGGAITATPEPASVVLLATGLLGVGGFGYRKRRVRSIV